jgi:uncharacterized damage-inducible protein DinB
MDLVDLIRAEAWAVSRWAEHLATLPAAPRAVRGEIAHIVAAHELWLGRHRGTPRKGWIAFPDWTAAELRRRALAVGAAWTAEIPRLTPAALAATRRFLDSTGTARHDRVADYLTHLLVHGTHHRGKAILLLRQARLPVIDTGFITWCRAGRP